VEKVKDFTGNTFRTMTSAKTWNVQNVRQGAVAVWATGPAVFLGLLLNILDALSYGTILFPLGDAIFEDTAPDGIAMFFVSTIVAQLVYVLMSKFKGGIGSEMIEVVPFVHKMTFVIINEIGRENPKAVMATTIVAYNLSSILTGAIFFALGLFKLGDLVSYFPRSILMGCIGGVGIFLVLTGVEVTAGIKGNLEYDLNTLEKLIAGDTILLWTVPLILCIALMLTQSFLIKNNNFLLPIYCFLIGGVFYIIYAAIPHMSLEDFRNRGWLFVKPESDIPFYHLYTYYSKPFSKKTATNISMCN